MLVSVARTLSMQCNSFYRMVYCNSTFDQLKYRTILLHLVLTVIFLLIGSDL